MKNVFLALILFCIMTGLAKGKTPLYYGPKKNLEFKVHDPSFQVATTVITLASSTPGIQFHFPLTLDDVTATSTPTGGAVLYSLNGELVELREDGTETVITDTPTALLSSTSELTTSGGAVILSAGASGSHTFTFPVAGGLSGEVLTSNGSGGHTYETSGGSSVCVLSGTSTAGVSEGNNAALTWEQRLLTGTQGDSCASVVSLSSNQFTIQGAGSWLISGSSPLYNCNDGRAALISTPSTNYATATYGTSERSNGGGVTNTRSMFSYATTTTGNIEFEVRTQCDTAATGGFGQPNGYTDEKWTEITIFKL